MSGDTPVHDRAISESTFSDNNSADSGLDFPPEIVYSISMFPKDGFDHFRKFFSN